MKWSDHWCLWNSLKKIGDGQGLKWQSWISRIRKRGLSQKYGMEVENVSVLRCEDFLEKPPKQNEAHADHAENDELSWLIHSPVMVEFVMNLCTEFWSGWELKRQKCNILIKKWEDWVNGNVACLFTELVVVLIVVLIRVIYVCYPLRLMILRNSAAYSRARSLPSMNVLPENEKHLSIVALPLSGDYWYSSWSGRLVSQLLPKMVR